MLQVKQVTLSRGQKNLLTQASVSINSGEKVGIVGSNGVGKSSLFQLIKGELECDHGDCELSNGVRIAEIRQEIPSGTQSALNYVVAGDAELANVYAQLEQAEAEDDGLKIAELYHRLAEIDGYSAESRAAKILLGLGFTQAQLSLPIDDFSGGWRMRLNLARVLLQPSDLLLLDEPTNHLDLEAIFWLENWLCDLKQTILIISHDREFLDQVVGRIIFLKDQQFYSYSGNYSQFESQYALQLEQKQATFLQQQRQIKHLQSFVVRFRYKASKAKQAQSRIKMIARMEKVASVQLSNPFNFVFKAAPNAGNPMISLRKVDIGYAAEPILHKVNLSIQPGDRLAFIGPNGAGKSTLIKALARKLTVRGEATFNTKLRLGYFTQHQLEALELAQSPIWHLNELDTTISEKEARQFLGSFNFQNDRIFEPIKNFSGGEKARLALALLVWQQPNLLLLDEPSNHLDLEMQSALSLALQQYDGALILITHDRFLLKSLANEFYLVADGAVQAFSGDLEDYQRWVAARQNEKSFVKEKQNKKGNCKVANSDSLEKKIAKLEQRLLQAQEDLKKIEDLLADLDIYQDQSRAKELTQYQLEARKLRTLIEKHENEILNLLEKC